jgi:hypothetical protein
MKRHAKQVWKFELADDFSIDLYRYYYKFNDCFFADLSQEDPPIVGHIKNGVLTIFKGYQWDGCTPKFKVCRKIIGVPDFDKTYEPSLVHDFLIEYCYQHDIPRSVIDRIWTQMLRENKFKLRWLYSPAVHSFRPLSYLLKPCPRN